MATQTADQKRNKSLPVLIGTAATALLMNWVPQFEGTILRGYKDPIGVVTACTGHTATAVLGKPYTRQECFDLLQKDLQVHAAGVNECTPVDELSIGQRAAAISFAFNVGVPTYCRSTFARKLKMHDPGACAELDKWVYAGNQVLPGLVKRRATERAMCEGRMG